MPILKLEAGQRVTFAIRTTEIVEGKFGQQVKFVGETPDGEAILFLNIDPARRQLARINLTEQTAQGQTVEFERVNRDGTLYTNINMPSRMPQPSSKPVATSGKEPYSVGGPLPYETESETGAPPTLTGLPRIDINKLDALFGLYDACFAHAHKLAHDKMGADSTHEAISAMAATTFIAALK